MIREFRGALVAVEVPARTLRCSIESFEKKTTNHVLVPIFPVAVNAKGQQRLDATLLAPAIETIPNV